MSKGRPEPRRRFVRTLNRSFLSAASQPGALALAATTGVVGSSTDVAMAGVVAAGGLVGGLLPDVVAAVSARVSGARAKNAAAALSVATEFAGVSDDELADRVEQDPFVARLTYETLQGAADATYDEKIAALGEVLGQALGAQGLEEQQKLLAQSTIVRELEEVHAAVLWTLAQEPPIAGADSDGPWNGWTLATLQQELGLGVLLTPVMETLQARGLVHDLVQSDGKRSNYGLSAWGDKILGLLMPAQDLDQPSS